MDARVHAACSQEGNAALLIYYSFPKKEKPTRAQILRIPACIILLILPDDVNISVITCHHLYFIIINKSYKNL